MEEKKTSYTVFGHGCIVKDQIAALLKLVISLKSFITDGIEVSREVTLVWAGACVILYSVLLFEKLLWPSKTQFSHVLRAALEAILEDFYVNIQHVLTFQLTSVLCT